LSTPLKERPSDKRIISLDLARGCMLLLIALAHAPLYLYTSEPGVMGRAESVTFIDTLINFFGELFIDNRARPMFAFLFGYGLVMIIEKQLKRGTSKKEATTIIRRRCVYFLIVGAVLAVIIGGQDILMAYGIAGILVSGLLFRKNSVLVKIISIITFVILLYLPLIWGLFVNEMGRYGFGTEFSADDRYVQLLTETFFILPIIPIFIHFLFPVLPAVLIGIWAGKKRLLLDVDQNKTLLKRITTIGLVISLIGAFPLVLIHRGWEPSYFIAGILYGVHIITGLAGGIAYATIFGMLGNKMKLQNLIITSLTALGKRSLTFYVVMETLFVVLLSPVSFGLGGKLTNTKVTVVAVFIWIVAVITAATLEKHNISGPLEKGMRSFVYKK
jgi:uncharacterized membrane protein YeiB